VNAQPAPVFAADPASADESVWLQSARDIVSDLFQRSPLIYWTDFLASITMAWGLTAAYFLTPPWSLLQITAFALAGVLGPLSYLHRGLREWVLTRASAAVSNVYFRKRCPKHDDGHLVIVELLCFGYLCAIAVLLLAGVITGTHLLMAYLLLAYTLGLNWVRNLAAHGYGNPGERMTYVEQLGDSINITDQHWLTVLLFPVGLRYHALHHLFPALPYRNLGEAHRRLTERLPPDAPYHATGRASFFAAASELWRSARQTPREDSAMRRWNP
jgi:fatty acid desaturase